MSRLDNEILRELWLELRNPDPREVRTGLTVHELLERLGEGTSSGINQRLQLLIKPLVLSNPEKTIPPRANKGERRRSYKLAKPADEEHPGNFGAYYRISQQSMATHPCTARVILIAAGAAQPGLAEDELVRAFLDLHLPNPLSPSEPYTADFVRQRIRLAVERGYLIAELDPDGDTANPAVLTASLRVDTETIFLDFVAEQIDFNALNAGRSASAS